MMSSDETNRLLEHRFAQLVREAREPLAVDGVVFLEPANVEPVAGKLGRQAPGAPILQHSPGLRGEHLGLVQIAGRGMLHQLFVRHARPEEVAQAARERIVGERPTSAVSVALSGSPERARRALLPRRERRGRRGSRSAATSARSSRRRESPLRDRDADRAANGKSRAGRPIRPSSTAVDRPAARTRAARRDDSGSAAAFAASSARTFVFIRSK